MEFSDLTFKVLPEHKGGVQHTNFFDNGYGVSIVQHSFSYGHEEGLYEGAVLLGKEDEYTLCYDTPVTSDVEGWLSEEKVLKFIEDVKALPQYVKQLEHKED